MNSPQECGNSGATNVPRTKVDEVSEKLLVSFASLFAFTFFPAHTLPFRFALRLQPSPMIR